MDTDESVVVPVCSQCGEEFAGADVIRIEVFRELTCRDCLAAFEAGQRSLDVAGMRVITCDAALAARRARRGGV